MSIQIKLWGVRGSLPAPLTPIQVNERISKLFKECAQYLKAENLEFNDQSIAHFLQKKASSEVGGYGGHTACIQVLSQQQNLIIDAGSGIRRLGEQLMSGPCGMGRGE